MKSLSALALALSLVAGAASAAQPASGAASATTAAKACSKEATAKKLHGDARVTFIKECKAGKQSS